MKTFRFLWSRSETRFFKDSVRTLLSLRSWPAAHINIDLSPSSVTEHGSFGSGICETVGVPQRATSRRLSHSGLESCLEQGQRSHCRCLQTHWWSGLVFLIRIYFSHDLVCSSADLWQGRAAEPENLPLRWKAFHLKDHFTPKTVPLCHSLLAAVWAGGSTQTGKVFRILKLKYSDVAVTNTENLNICSH